MKNAWRSPGAGAALMILLTAVAYLPALRGGFVFDDPLLITDNPLVRASDGLRRCWLTTEAPDYYPLTWSVWWLEWRLWGANPMGYHVVNVLLHAINAVLVWLVLRRLRIPGAWVAALVFAVHPVNVATVAWVSEQKNTLSMLFYAVAILLYLRFDEGGHWRWYGLSLTAFLLALLSKTAVVMLPVVLLGCVWWRHDRVRWRDCLCSVPFFVLSLVLGLVTIRFQQDYLLKGYTIPPVGFPSRLAAAGAVPWFYLYKTLVPLNLTVIYPKWDVPVSLWISYVPGIILVSCLAVFWWKRKTWGRPLSFGLGYMVVMLFPVLGFIDQGFYRHSLVADHWQYYSIVGTIALAVAAGEFIFRPAARQGRYWAVATGVAVLMVLGVATWERGSVYADDETLWRDNLARNPDAWLAHNNLGVTLGKAGRIDDAIRHLKEAVRIEPDYAEVHSNLGNVFLQAGRLEDAIGQYEQALRTRPDLAEVHYNLGNALSQAGRVPEAVVRYEQALRIKPDYAEAHNHLGVALARLGLVPEAIGHYEEALRIRPDYARAHYNLAAALEQTGRIKEAVGHYEQALKIKPDYAEAQNRLARLRAIQ